MAKSIEVLILAEDDRQANFVRHFLQERNVSPGKIRILPLPSGHGSSFGYVLGSYPKELAPLRRRAAASGLVVVVDADTLTFHERYKELAEALKKARLDLPDASECVAILIPRRNIETWLYHLLGNQVTEEHDYKHRVKDRDVQQVAQVFANDCPTLPSTRRLSR